MKKYINIYFVGLMITLGACDPTFEYEPSDTPNGELGVPIAQFIATNENFTLLEAAVTKAGLTETLTSTTNLTLFAPNDLAFEAFLDTLTLDDIPAEQLRDVLLYHVVPEALLSPDSFTLEDRPFETLLPDKTTSLRIDDSNRVYANSNRVVTSNLEATNGVIHVLDRVLTP